MFRNRKNWSHVHPCNCPELLPECFQSCGVRPQMSAAFTPDLLWTSYGLLLTRRKDFRRSPAAPLSRVNTAANTLVVFTTSDYACCFPQIQRYYSHRRHRDLNARHLAPRPASSSFEYLLFSRVSAAEVKTFQWQKTSVPNSLNTLCSCSQFVNHMYN